MNFKHCQFQENCPNNKRSDIFPKGKNFKCIKFIPIRGYLPHRSKTPKDSGVLPFASEKQALSHGALEAPC